MGNFSINNQYASEIGKQSRERLYTKEELATLKLEHDLSPEEVKYLRTQRKYCDSTNFKKVSGNRNELVKSVMLMVLKMARSYWWATGKRTVPLDDVIQAGNLGATIAADNYLKSAIPAGKREAKFSTYAWPWIKRYILDELNITSQQLTTGVRGAYENRLKGIQFSSKDDTALGKDGEYESPINNDLRSDIGAGQEILEIQEQNKRNTDILRKAFSALSDIERKVLIDVYGLGDNDIISQREAASKYGMSTSAINAIIKRSHHKIYWALSESEREIMANFDAKAGLDIRSILCEFDND